MSSRVTSLKVVQQFFQPALNSTTLTLVSTRTGTRFTYKVARKKPNEDGTADEVWYVDVLTGSNNEADYSPLAVLTKRDGRIVYHHTWKGRISGEAPSAVAFRWALDQVVIAGNETAFEKVEVWHEGRCGRCGRKLTRPESIELGLGPECEGKV